MKKILVLVEKVVWVCFLIAGLMLAAVCLLATLLGDGSLGLIDIL